MFGLAAWIRTDEGSSARITSQWLVISENGKALAFPRYILKIGVSSGVCKSNLAARIPGHFFVFPTIARLQAPPAGNFSAFPTISRARSAGLASAIRERAGQRAARFPVAGAPASKSSEKRKNCQTERPNPRFRRTIENSDSPERCPLPDSLGCVASDCIGAFHHPSCNDKGAT